MYGILAQRGWALGRRVAFMFKYLQITLAVIVLLITSSCTRPPNITAPQPLTVGAAASLQFALTDIGKLFEDQTGQRVIFTFGSTGNLAKQIENGAPIDLFLSADVIYVDELREKKRIHPETQQIYGQGRIVLASSRAPGIQVKALKDLLDPAIKHVAIANPNHAPFGLAAKQAMISANIWDQIQPKLVFGENIRQTLQFIQTGNAEAGVIALSIAEVPEITYVLIAEELHAPLDLALAVVKGSRQEKAAREFAAFILGPFGQPVLQKYGFQTPVQR